MATSAKELLFSCAFIRIYYSYVPSLTAGLPVKLRNHESRGWIISAKIFGPPIQIEHIAVSIRFRRGIKYFRGVRPNISNKNEPGVRFLGRLVHSDRYSSVIAVHTEGSQGKVIPHELSFTTKTLLEKPQHSAAPSCESKLGCANQKFDIFKSTPKL